MIPASQRALRPAALGQVARTAQRLEVWRIALLLEPGVEITGTPAESTAVLGPIAVHVIDGHQFSVDYVAARASTPAAVRREGLSTKPLTTGTKPVIDLFAVLLPVTSRSSLPRRRPVFRTRSLERRLCSSFAFGISRFSTPGFCSCPVSRRAHPRVPFAVNFHAFLAASAPGCPRYLINHAQLMLSASGFVHTHHFTSRNDPYLIAELATDEDRRTSFRGELNPEPP